MARHEVGGFREWLPASPVCVPLAALLPSSHPLAERVDDTLPGLSMQRN